MSIKRVRFAIIGAGMIGAVHAAALAEQPETAELVVIADVDRAKASPWREQHGAEHTDDLTACCLATTSTPSPSAPPAVCTRMSRSRRWTPASTSSSRSPSTSAWPPRTASSHAEARSGKKATVISQHRFDRSTETVLQAVTDGTLGTITSAIASHAWWRGQSYYDSGDWRGTWALDGGGAAMNQTVHTINLLLTMVGTPVEVFAYTACLAHERIEVEDTAVAVLRFASGALGIIHGTTAAYPGLDAGLGLRHQGFRRRLRRPARLPPRDGGRGHGDRDVEHDGWEPVTPAHQIGSDELSFGHAHRLQLADFIAAVTTGGTPRVSTSDARTSLAVILGLYESAATGLPVRL